MYYILRHTMGVCVGQCRPPVKGVVLNTPASKTDERRLVGSQSMGYVLKVDACADGSLIDTHTRTHVHFTIHMYKHTFTYTQYTYTHILIYTDTRRHNTETLTHKIQSMNLRSKYKRPAKGGSCFTYKLY